MVETTQQHQVRPVAKQPGGFDAFISYSRDDIGFARVLQKRLAQFRPPSGLGSERRRMRVFRDESDIHGTVYTEAITSTLRQSRKMILICSPAARASDYVAEEISWFAEMHGARNIIPILLSGRPNNEFTAGEKDDRAFPEVLVDLLDEPLAAEYRGFEPANQKPDQGAYRNAWYTILANVYDVSRNEIEQRDFRRRRRERIITITVVSLVIASLATFGAIAWLQKLEAERQKHVALTGLAVNLAGKSRDLVMREPDMGLLMAVEAIRVTTDHGIDPAVDALQAMRDTLAANGGWSLADSDEKLLEFGFDAQSETVFALSASALRRWRISQQAPVSLTPPNVQAQFAPAQVATTVGGRWRVLVNQEAVRVTDLHTDESVSYDKPDEVTHIAISDNGRWLATGVANGDVLVREALAGNQWQRLELESATPSSPEIRRIGFGPGGGVFYALYTEATVRAWNPAVIDRPLMSLSLSRFSVDSVVISPDNRWLTLTAWREPLRLYALDAGGAEMVPGGQEVEPKRARFSPDGRWLAVIDASGRLLLWSTKDFAAKPVTLTESADSFGARLVFSNDGSRLAASDTGERILLWKTDRLTRRPQQVTYPGRVTALALSPNGRLLAIANDSVVRLVPANRLAQKPLILRHGQSIKGLEISQDNRWLAARGRAMLRLWSITDPFAASHALPGAIAQPEIRERRDRSGSMGGTFIDSRSEYTRVLKIGLPNAADFAANGKWFATIGRNGDVLLVDRARPWQSVRRLGGVEGGTTAIAFSPDSAWLAAGGYGRNVLVWNTQRPDSPPLQLKRAETADATTIIRLEFSRDSRWLAVGGGFGEVSIWDWRAISRDTTTGDTSTQASLPTHQGRLLEGHEEQVLSVEFSSDNSRLVTADGKVVLIWNVGDWSLPPIRVAGNMRHYLARFAGDRNTLVTAGEDAMVRVWDLNDTEPVARELRGHEAGILNMVIAPGGRWLATASDDRHVLLWDLIGDSLLPVEELEHPVPVAAIAFGDTKRLVTGGFDGVIRLWNRSDPTAPPIRLAHHTVQHEKDKTVWWVGEDQAGRALASLGSDGVANLWPIEIAQQTSIACETAGTNLSYALWREAMGDKPYDKTCAQFDPHPSLLQAASRQAEKGSVIKAMELFSRAVTLNPRLGLDPERQAVDIAVAAMIKRAKRLARKGSTLAASVQFEKAQALKPGSVDDAMGMANKLAAAQVLLRDGEKLAKKGRFKAAVARYFTAKAIDPEIEVDPTAKAAEHALPVMLGHADRIAQSNDRASAMRMYREILSIDPDQSIDPQVRAAQQAALGYRREGEKAAINAKIDSAIESFRHALELDPDLDIEPQGLAYRLAAPRLATNALKEVHKGKVEQGMQKLQLAISSDPELEIQSKCWAQLCWYGGLWSKPQAVTAACEKAVAMEPDNGGYRDSRGLVRALDEDLAGAAEDFRAYVEWAPEHGRSLENIAQRRDWLQSINQGNNPVTDELLEALRDQEKHYLSVYRCP